MAIATDSDDEVREIIRATSFERDDVMAISCVPSHGGWGYRCYGHLLTTFMLTASYKWAETLYFVFRETTPAGPPTVKTLGIGCQEAGYGLILAGGWAWWGLASDSEMSGTIIHSTLTSLILQSESI